MIFNENGEINLKEGYFIPKLISKYGETFENPDMATWPIDKKYQKYIIISFTKMIKGCGSFPEKEDLEYIIKKIDLIMATEKKDKNYSKEFISQLLVLKSQCEDKIQSN